jgi:hypothetical protein
LQGSACGAEGVSVRAVEVQGAISAVSANVAALRSILVRVVRTVSTDTDRRGSPRLRVDMPVVVTNSRGSQTTSRLIDVSEGGARIASVSDLNLRDTCTLQIEGLRGSIPFIVRDRSDDQILLGLTADGENQAAIPGVASETDCGSRGGLILDYSACEAAVVSPQSRSRDANRPMP